MNAAASLCRGLLDGLGQQAASARSATRGRSPRPATATQPVCVDDAGAWRRAPSSKDEKAAEFEANAYHMSEGKRCSAGSTAPAATPMAAAAWARADGRQLDLWQLDREHPCHDP